MKKDSIALLTKQFNNGEIGQEKIHELRNDERKGVQQLIKRYEKQQLELEKLEKNFQEMSQYEWKRYAEGNHYIAGIDEAGRGPLAGPVVAAAVILPRDFKLLGLNDSKQLNENQRNEFFAKIKANAISYGISIITNEKIDELNILQATKVAMRDAVHQLEPYPDHIFIDAVELDGLSCTYESIIKGDSKSITIAAASVLAKVTRDRMMEQIHEEYPEYDFKNNMGYGTKQHMNALTKYGPTPYHRKSFGPVKQSIHS